MRMSFLFCSCIILLSFGCRKGPTTTATASIEEKVAATHRFDVAVPKDSSEMAKTYVNNNTYIDVDLQKLSIESQLRRNGLNLQEKAKLRAAVYRFYKHVKVNDGTYVYDNADAKSLNISTEILSYFKENLTNSNKAVTQLQKEGKDVKIYPINEAYLKSLLSNKPEIVNIQNLNTDGRTVSPIIKH